MRWTEIALIVLAVSLFVGIVLWSRANRLDRLHRKVVGTRIALDRQLGLRAAAAGELATTGALDPASSILVADAAYAVMDEISGTASSERDNLSLVSLGEKRQLLESQLSATLRQALGDEGASEVTGEIPEADASSPESGEPETAEGNLLAIWYRAVLARRFHNEAVYQARRARRHWWVRLFHLAGGAPLPETVDLDDTLPVTR